MAALRTSNDNHWVSQVGTAFDPGLPFGDYQLCLRDTARAALVTWHLQQQTPNGYAAPNVDPPFAVNQADGLDASTERCCALMLVALAKRAA